MTSVAAENSSVASIGQDPEADWFLHCIVQDIAKQGNLMGVVCARCVAVRIVDAVASVGGMAIGPLDKAALNPDVMSTLITVGRARFRAIRNEFHAGRSHNALTFATDGLQEAMKDNLLRGAREGDAKGECARNELDSVSGTPASVLLQRLDALRLSAPEVQNLTSAR